MKKLCLIGGEERESLALVSNAFLPDWDLLSPASAPDEADLVLISLGHPQQKALSTSLGNKAYRITPFHFWGLHPDIVYPTPSLPFHSKKIIDAFAQGVPQNQVPVLFDRPEKCASDLWDNEIDRLRAIDQQVDFPSAGLVNAYCKMAPGFLTPHTPCLSLVALYFSSICAQLSIQRTQVNLTEAPDPLCRFGRTPIYDRVAEALDLPYRTTQQWQLGDGFPLFVNAGAFVDMSYRTYQTDAL